jgi:hypothetical protein
MGDAKPGRYTVHVTTDDPPIYYNNDGNGYTLSGAKNFARIGSQKRKDGTWGEDRAVTRGVRGPVIRVYSHGERLWPLYASQVNALQGKGSLRPGEMPKKLAFDGIGDKRDRTVKATKVGQSYRAVPASEPWRSCYLTKHPTWQ